MSLIVGREPRSERAWMRFDGSAVHAMTGTIVDEVPVAFVYGARAHVVVMATPADLEDLATGFSVTEGIVAHASDITGLAIERHAKGIELRIGVPSAVAERLAHRARALPARTGCGLCGVEAIEDALRAPRAVTGVAHLDIANIYAAVRTLEGQQDLNRGANALHAAGWATADGVLTVAREDVGRHNAVDKVIGALLRAGTDPAQGMLVVTSRASVELVQKAAAVGVPVLAAVSRPTALAIRMAESCGMTLAGLVRGESANVYAGAERVHG